MSYSYYTYVHRAGYGRDDHMADELIARAIRALGVPGAEASIAAAVGLASHAVPMDGANVRIPAGPGVRVQMERALRSARREFARRPDLSVTVVCCRKIRRDGRIIIEERHGARWVAISDWEACDE